MSAPAARPELLEAPAPLYVAPASSSSASSSSAPAPLPCGAPAPCCADCAIFAGCTIGMRPRPARAIELSVIGEVKEHSRPDHVLLDLDLPRPWRRWGNGRRLPLRAFHYITPIREIRGVCAIVGLRVEWVRYDRTKKGFHAVIKLAWRDRLKRAEMTALQAILGSDSRREALNLMRVRAMRQYGAPPEMRDHWNILFARKLEKSRRKRR